ncbi:MAG: MMPL family transporter, partial [Syntrophorhabdales bacterium]
MRAARHHRVRRWLQRLLALQMSHPLTALAFWVALAVASVVFTAGHLSFQASQQSLISPSNRLMRLLKMADRFSDLDGFVVAIENRNTRRTLEFVRQLAPRLEGDHEHYDQVFYRVDPARLRPWALLYLDEKDLLSLRDSLREHGSFIRDFARSPSLAAFFEEVNDQMAASMVGELFTGFLNEGNKAAKKNPMDLGFLVQTLRQMKMAMEGPSAFASPWRSFFKEGPGEEDEEGYFWTENKRYLLVLVTPNLKGEGFSKGQQALAALRQTVASVKADFRDIDAGVTGQKALDEDEKDLALKDIGLATSLSLIGLAALLITFWRGIRRPLLAVAVLVVALCVTFGLTTLFIGHLNILSVTFAPMLLGLGIDYAVHWFARYSEERHRSLASTKEALASTMEKVGPAILLAGLSASLSFFPLVLTGFKGLSELGLICSMGLAVATAATLFLLPTLILLLGRFRIRMVRKPVTDDIKPLFRNTKRRDLLLLAIAVCVSALSLGGALKVKFDLNMLHLQSRSAESVIWENKLIEGSRYASIYGVLFAHSFREIDEKTKAAERLPTVSKVNSIRSVLPTDQEHKILLLREMKPLLGDVRHVPVPSEPVDIDRIDKVFSRIRFKMLGPSEWGEARPLFAQMQEVRRLIDAVRHDFASIPQMKLHDRLKRFENLMIGDLNDKLSLLHENMETRPLEPRDLPRPLADRFVGPDNLYLLRIFPAGNVWDPQFLGAFVRDLRSIDPDVTGDPVTLYVFTKAFRDACVKAALYAVVFIVIFLALALRSPVSILAALTPLVLGTLWTFGL